MEKVELGKTYKDEVSGFVGTATARCEYLKGSTQVSLTAKALDGKEPATAWFLESQVAEVEIKVAL